MMSTDVPRCTRLSSRGNTLTPGLPESFNVLVKELQSLCLDVELISTDEAVEVEAGESSEVLTEESGE